MKAETAPATPALPKRSKLVSAASDFFSTTVCMRRFVPNCDAVIGAMLTMFIYVEGQVGEGGEPKTPSSNALVPTLLGCLRTSIARG